MSRNFMNLLKAQWDQGKHSCLGLDPDAEEIGKRFPGRSIIDFNTEIVDQTHDIVGVYKPNMAFYEGEELAGLQALEDTIKYINRVAPHVPVILDGKRGDIGNTNRGYVKMAFNWMKADALTLHPYMGGKSLSPFLAHPHKGFFVLCRTSNDGAGEFQDLLVQSTATTQCTLYEHVAANVADSWNLDSNCGLVVGATCPEELARVRAAAPNIPLLVPGYGEQGGGLAASVKAARHCFIINSSRGIIFSKKGPRAAATELHEGILQHLGR